MTRVVVRPAVVEDIPHFFDGPLPWRIKALTGFVDDEPIGIGGVAFPPGGGPLVFSSFKEKARAYPIEMHRAGLRLMKELRDQGVHSVRATAEEGIPAAERWLQRLGFVPSDLIEGQVVWTWHS